MNPTLKTSSSTTESDIANYTTNANSNNNIYMDADNIDYLSKQADEEFNKKRNKMNNNRINNKNNKKFIGGDETSDYFQENISIDDLINDRDTELKAVKNEIRHQG